MRRFMIATVLLAGLAACHHEDDAAAKKAADAALLAYKQQVIKVRGERIARLTKPTGWLSLVGLHWLEQGSTRVGSGEDNGTRLSVGPAHIGVLTLDKDGKLNFEPESGAGITIDGQPASSAVRLVPDSEGEPTVVGFDNGEASFVVHASADRFGLRVRDARAKTLTQFAGIDYFDIDPSFRLVGKFNPHPPGQKIEITNILGQVEPMDNPGTLTIQKDGKTFTMEAVDEGDHRLFFTFADRTSGHETYAAARFVYAAYPGPDGTTALDFNTAYNPPCAFTPYATCPLPPPSNRLDMAVRAGERKPRVEID